MVEVVASLDFSTKSVGGDMSPWAVAFLPCLAVYFVEASDPFDCDNPESGYTCDGGRYYRVLENVLWQSAHDECEGDGAQLAIAYSAQDIDAMNRIMGEEG